MKCKQKLCQRNKNLKDSGNCNVCDDVIGEELKKHNTLLRKKPSVSNVQVDLKAMVDVHEKLANGAPIDQKMVSRLLLAGVINILNQHDIIVDLEKRLTTNDIENVTMKVRVESLENWVLKQEETVKNLEEKLSKVELEKGNKICENVEALKTKVSQLEGSLETQKKTATSTCPIKEKACKECERTFSKNFELETHMVSFHGGTGL